MTFKGKFIGGLSALLLFGVGVFVDRSFKDFPYLQLDPKIGVLDIANLLVAILIAVMIPFFVSKIIDDKRLIKTLLIDEIKDLIKIIAEIKSIIAITHSKGIFEPKDRDNINYVFHEAELKIGSIREQMEIAFKYESKDESNNLGNLLLVYKNYITGGELMLSTFTSVNEHFYRESNTEYSKIETGLKTLMLKVYKY